MFDVYTRGFVPLRRWQGSQSSIRWATDAEVRAEFGVDRAEFIERWRNMKRNDWVLWANAQRLKSGVVEAPRQQQAPMATRQPGSWTGHKVQTPKIGGKR